MRRVGAVSAVVGLGLALAACGGQSTVELLPTGATGASSPAPAEAPSPSPAPTPTPTPAPTTTPDPVARVTIKVAGINCGESGPLPNPDSRQAIPVGCKVLLELSAKDADNKPAVPQSPPEWTFDGDLSAVKITEDDYGPSLNAVAPGQISVHATVDGVKSNVLDLVFHTP